MRVGVTGACSLVVRYVNDEYVPEYRISVDFDFSQKKLRLGPERNLNLQVSLSMTLIVTMSSSCGTCPVMRDSGVPWA